MNGGLNTLRLLLKMLVAAANVLVVVLLVAAAYSDRVSPNTVLLFSYLGLGFPILCVLNLCFVIYWLFLGEWRLLLVGLCAFLVCQGAVSRYFPFHSHTKDLPKENVLKVLTYNVMGFAYKDHTKKSPNEILDYVAASGADIVCFQEYTVGKQGNILTSKKVYDALNMYPYHSVIPIHSTGNMITGIAVFSKYPISASRRIKYESNSNASAIHELNINGKKLTLINNHLESFKLTMEDRSRYTAFLKYGYFRRNKRLPGAEVGPRFQDTGQASRSRSGRDCCSKGRLCIGLWRLQRHSHFVCASHHTRLLDGFVCRVGERTGGDLQPEYLPVQNRQYPTLQEYEVYELHSGQNPLFRPLSPVVLSDYGRVSPVFSHSFTALNTSPNRSSAKKNVALQKSFGSFICSTVLSLPLFAMTLSAG